MDEGSGDSGKLIVDGGNLIYTSKPEWSGTPGEVDLSNAEVIVRLGEWRALAVERDALAERVSDLEAELARYHVWVQYDHEGEQYVGSAGTLEDAYRMIGHWTPLGDSYSIRQVEGGVLQEVETGNPFEHR